VKAVRFFGNRHCEVITVPDPAPGAGEVIIEMRAAGLCGSDLEWYRGDPPGDGSRPVVPGHEPCGTVAAVGSKVSGWGVGDRVVVNHHYGCGVCLPCREGSPKYCRGDHGTYGFTDDGADAQYMAAKANALIALPDSLSYEDGAAISCGVGTAYAALCRLGISGRETLVIFGQGPVGLSATMLATTMGAQVIACEMSDERLRLAASAGAAHTIDVKAVDPPDAIVAITAGHGVDAALDCSGSSAGRVAAIRATRPRGQVCFVGVGPPTAFDVSEEIIGKELTVYGSWTFTAAGLIRCMDFVTRHSCQLSRLISLRSAIEDAAGAFALFDSASTGKCMLVF
jgi:(R,R)-butanediol dehydrogenase / meso-butanediol dehydrogenase / diacetyl reductase